MNSTTLFGMALGLQTPWQVNDISFAAEASSRKELHLHIGFERGSRFPDKTGAACPVHDTVAREWQHLNFFEHHCFLHCSVPRITTTDGNVVTVSRPWSRPGSGFTLLFEAVAMALIEGVTVLFRNCPSIGLPKCWASTRAVHGCTSVAGAGCAGATNGVGRFSTIGLKRRVRPMIRPRSPRLGWTKPHHAKAISTSPSALTCGRHQ